MESRSLSKESLGWRSATADYAYIAYLRINRFIVQFQDHCSAEKNFKGKRKLSLTSQRTFYICFYFLYSGSSLTDLWVVLKLEDAEKIKLIWDSSSWDESPTGHKTWSLASETQWYKNFFILQILLRSDTFASIA